MDLFLGYEMYSNVSGFLYIFYFLNFTGHTVLVSVINPSTHTIANYTSGIPSFLLVAHANGTPYTFHLNSSTIPAFEIIKKGIYIYSTNGILLERVNGNGNMTLVYANFPEIAHESPPDFRELAGQLPLLPVNMITLLGVVLALQLFLILRRVMR